MTSNTVRLHRVLKAPAEKIYRAFLTPEALAKWIPPNGFTATVHHIEARVGGTFKMSFTNFTTQEAHSFGGEYLASYMTNVINNGSPLPNAQNSNTPSPVGNLTFDGFYLETLYFITRNGIIGNFSIAR